METQISEQVIGAGTPRTDVGYVAFQRCRTETLSGIGISERMPVCDRGA